MTICFFSVQFAQLEADDADVESDLKPLKQDLFRSLGAYWVLCLSSVEDMKESQNMHLVEGNWVSKETGFCILNFL
jgi:hypothetical protein